MFGLGTIINIVVNVIPAVVNVVSAIVAQGNNFIANAVNTVAGWFGGGSGSSGSGGSNSSRSSGGSSSNRGPSSVSNFEEQRRIAVQQRQQRQSLERDISYSLEQSEPEEEPPLNFADLLLPALVPAEIMLAAWGNPVAESMVIMLRNERGLFEAMMNAAASPEEGLRNLFAEAGRNDEWDRQALDLFNRFKSDMQIVGTKTNQLHGGGGDDLIDPTSPSSEDVQAHIYDTGVGSDDILPTAEELRRIVAINTTLEQLDILTSLPSNHILYMSPDPAQRGVGDFRILSDIVAHNTSNNLEDYLYVINTFANYAAR